jgi:hypothetical protein
MTSANADAVRDSASDTLDQLQRAAAPALKEGKRQAGALLDQAVNWSRGLVLVLARPPPTWAKA